MRRQDKTLIGVVLLAASATGVCLASLAVGAVLFSIVRYAPLVIVLYLMAKMMIFFYRGSR